MTNTTQQTAKEKKNNNLWKNIWTQAQFLNLSLTIVGQIILGANYLFGQLIWLAANCIAVIRDIVLKRPFADIVKDVAMSALTLGLIIFYLLGGFNI